MLPFSEVNLLSVVVASFACMGIGMLWYGPLFGQSWMKLVGLKMDKSSKEGMGMVMLYGLLNTFVMVYVIALLVASHPASLQQTLVYAAISWLGFSATTKAADAIWARKPWALVGIDIGYTLVAILVSAWILVSWA